MDLPEGRPIYRPRRCTPAYPPTMDSCDSPILNFCHAPLRSPGSYGESLRFAITPSNPRLRAAVTPASGNRRTTDERHRAAV
jgi:hypothetical protein